MEKDKRQKPEVIEAAGGLLWRGTPEQPEIAVIHRLRYNDWTLPKGKRETGESWHETALREVLEETGCNALLHKFAGGVVYTVEEIPKVVLYWHMQILEYKGFMPNKEVDQLAWLSPENAREILSYEGEADLIPSTFFDILARSEI